MSEAEAAYVLTHYPFEKLRVVSSRWERNIVMTPANILFVANEIHADLPVSPVKVDEACVQASHQTSADMGMTWPWGDYQTPLLEVLAATVEKFFVPRPASDPKRETVIAWIKDRMREAGLSESNQIAESIFTIIKPSDHDPRRRRPNL